MAKLIPARDRDELHAAIKAGAVILANEGRHGRPDTYHLCPDPKLTCEPHEYVAVVPWNAIERDAVAALDDRVGEILEVLERVNLPSHALGHVLRLREAWLALSGPEAVRYAEPDYEERRPGFNAIYIELREKHPRWTHDRVVAQAKVTWHDRNPGGVKAVRHG